MERLQKVIANSGYTSRRKAEELITQGKVEVNGEVVTELGTKVSTKDSILVEGKPIKSVEKVYYVLFKPEGFVSTTDDEFNRRKVTDLVPSTPRVYPVGRLDYDTSGILFLTNDGEFANELSNPTKKVEKEYIVTMQGFLRKEESKRLCNGIIIDKYKTKKARIFDVTYNKKNETTQAHIVITEGKYHQVKRMFEAVGHPVIRLKRIRIGMVTLDQMSKGEYRLLKPYELKQLRQLTK